MRPIRIHVSKPGWFSTVQDLGRYGYQQYGVPVAGVMDHYAAIVANRLVGNQDNAAVLELTLKGPELHFEEDTGIAITGADLSPTMGSTRIPQWECVKVSRGSRLCFGTAQSGTRAYLAISGGIDVPLILGSRSTHCASESGGFKGRPLRRGDVLHITHPKQSPQCLDGTRLSDERVPRYRKTTLLRVIPGPHRNLFSTTSLTTLLSSSYIITPESNRMGYRLAGPIVVRDGQGHFISDGTTIGALQLPPDGQPILLMAAGRPPAASPRSDVSSLPIFPSQPR